jgi:hypothetical protein
MPLLVAVSRSEWIFSVRLVWYSGRFSAKFQAGRRSERRCVGGFLGVGKKDVAVSWRDLKVMNNGEKVVMNTTKDQLKAMPAFTYPADHHPGDVYSSKAIRDRGTGTSSMPGNR